MAAHLTPILMLGGLYLCDEGAEKVSGHDAAPEQSRDAAAADPAGHERTVVAGAVRTDFILSAEIMGIALNEVASEGFVARALILVVVAIGITALVYGAVALIVKMDDVGLALAGRGAGAVRVRARARRGHAGRAVGPGDRRIAAMLWVGGHILLVGVDELGLHAPYATVRHLEEVVRDATGPLGGFLGWLTNTVASALLGVVVGAVVVAVAHLVPWRGRKGKVAESPADGPARPVTGSEPPAGHRPDAAG